MSGVEAGHAAQFLERMGQRDRAGAMAIARSLIAGGASSIDVIADILTPAQRRAGELWESGQWTVSQEHAATAIVEDVLAALPPAQLPGPARGQLLLACCEHEWHSLPARMLGELLRNRGWEVTFLGASTPADDLGDFLLATDPLALVASCSVSINLPGAARIIDAAHASGYRVLVGGAALTTADRAAALGADGWGSSIDDADTVLDQWRADPPPPRSVVRPGAVGAAAITFAQPRLVEEAMATLRRTFSAMATSSDREVSRIRADLDDIVGFAAAAVLVSDATVFTDFTPWLEAMLGRTGHPGIFAASLRGLAAVSGDHPDFLELLGGAGSPSSASARGVVNALG